MKTVEYTPTEFVLKLCELSSDDVERVGAKAANEAELLQADFKVPDAIVLTTDAYEYFLKANHIGPRKTRSGILSASIPETILDALHAGIADLGGYPFAIRSSAIAEDLPDASFAGQYETTLNVDSDESLQSAVLNCWASTLSPHVVAYRNKQGLSSSGMAVLVQKMVPADSAGVAFSANPVSGDRDEVVINAVRGLGERLVSGDATPDEWTAKNGHIQCQRAPEEALQADKVKVIAEIARRVESHFGTPQDIEWALADGELYILQARPITTLPNEVPEMIPIPIEVPPGFWEHDVSRFPTPPSILFKIAADEVVPPAAKFMAEEFGLLMDGVEITVIGGWPYQRMKPLGGNEPPPISLPKPVMWLLVRLIPTMRARIKQAREAVRKEKAGRFIRQWYKEWLPDLKVQIEKHQEMDLGNLSDTDLLQYIEDVISFTIWSIKIHTLLSTSVSLILYQFVRICQELLDWDETQVFELFSGTSYKSTEPARRLNELAHMAQDRPAVSQLLEHIDDHTLQRLGEIDSEFAEAFTNYQRTYGCRTIRWGIQDPTLAERPSLSLSLIHDQMLRSYDLGSADDKLTRSRSQKVSSARDLLSGDPKALDSFNYRLEQAELAYPVREDSNFFTFSAPFAFFRYAFLEVGNRLADRGVIAARDDVFFLYKEEACSALFKASDLKTLVQRHKGERAWAIANPGPPYYGEPPAPPSFDFLPSEARLIMESMIWSFNQMMEYEGSKREQKVGESLTGIPASAGQYTGPVRIIKDESQFHKIKPGDVMVCPMTSPVWSVLFPSIGALVTDTGGLLSHPAIIAREYRVPAVVATGNATSLLRDGEIVTIDGTKGIVEVLRLNPEKRIFSDPQTTP
jgi:phosphohistidine swiveling domain-containing protein